MLRQSTLPEILREKINLFLTVDSPEKSNSMLPSFFNTSQDRRQEVKQFNHMIAQAKNSQELMNQMFASLTTSTTINSLLRKRLWQGLCLYLGVDEEGLNFRFSYQRNNMAVSNNGYINSDFIYEQIMTSLVERRMKKNGIAFYQHSLPEQKDNDTLLDVNFGFEL